LYVRTDVSITGLLIRSTFFYQAGAADINPSVSLRDAIATPEKTLDGTYNLNGRPATLEFVVQPCGFAALTHVIQIRNENAGTWYEAFVDAHNNTILSVTEFIVKASVSSAKQLDSSYFLTTYSFFLLMQYRVIPIPVKVPDTEGFFDINDPEDLTASPNG